jgi:DNA-binding NarL/FixJ family response regulator
VISRPLSQPQQCLTAAEQQVVERYARGDSMRAIAAERSCSLRTVANQIQSAYRKLRVSSRIELVRALSGGGVEGG